MSVPTHRLASAMAVVFTTLCVTVAEASDTFVFHHENVMGTSLEFRVLADSRQAAQGAEDRVLREIDRLSAIFSGYDVHSELSRWQAAPKGPIRISAELFEVLKLSDHYREARGGAFDPRVEVLMKLWAEAARRDRRPVDDELARAKALMRATTPYRTTNA